MSIRKFLTLNSIDTCKTWLVLTILCFKKLEKYFKITKITQEVKQKTEAFANTKVEIKTLAKVLTWRVDEMRHQWKEVLKETRTKIRAMSNPKKTRSMTRYPRHCEEELRRAGARSRRSVTEGGVTRNQVSKLDGDHASLVDPENSEDRVTKGLETKFLELRKFVKVVEGLHFYTTC